MSAPTLTAMIGSYPNTMAFKTGQIKSDLLNLNFADVKTPSTAFKRTIAQEFDVSELAFMTYLQARDHGKPLIALPVVVVGRFQHTMIAYNAARGTLKPADLPGHRVGIRSYAQTTPTWVRGILQEDYGVDTSRVQWVTFDGGHIPEFSDPPGVQRAPAGKQMMAMLLAGELDAAVVTDTDLENPQLKTLIPDPDQAAAGWHKKYGTIQVNHIVVVKQSLSQTEPGLVREVYRMLAESKKIWAHNANFSGLDMVPLGYSAVRKNFEVGIDYAWRQKLISRKFSVDELFDDVTRALD